MEVEFEEYFQFLEKLSNFKERDIENILKPLKFHLWILWLKKFMKIFIIFASICLAIYYVEILNWYFCAICRILMIKILPIWDWTTLGNAKCLIEKTSLPSSKDYNNNESKNFNAKDCWACERFGK